MTGAGHPSRYRTVGALALAPAFPLALAGPADTSTPAGSRPARDPAALWLRTAAAGLGVLAAAAAAVSFTAFGGLRYRNCLNAVQAVGGRGLAVSGLVGCGG